LLEVRIRQESEGAVISEIKFYYLLVHGSLLRVSENGPQDGGFHTRE
jgi:hypothetical protein